MFVELSIYISGLTEGEGVSDDNSRVNLFLEHGLEDELLVLVGPELATIHCLVFFHKSAEVEMVGIAKIVAN